MPGRHTAKQKRQAKHVAASERARGMSADAATSVGWATVNKRTAKAVVFSIDSYRDLVKDLTTPPETPAPRRPRPQSKTIKMRPISNEEASANLRAGKFREKSLRLKLRHIDKAMRRRKKLAKGPFDSYVTVKPRSDFGGENRANYTQTVKVPAVLQPRNTSEAPRTQGEFDPRTKAPITRQYEDTRGLPPKRNSSPAPPAVKPAPALVAAKSHVSKSATDANKAISNTEKDMSKTNYNDLFKSELATDDGADDAVMIHCPHCDEGITKSQVLEKSKHKKLAAQNQGGGTDKGAGKTGGTLSSSRPGKGPGRKTDVVAGTAAMKSDAADDDESGSVETDVAKSAPAVEETKKLAYAASIRTTIDGSVHYVDTGSDAALAKAIMEGRLGGTPVTAPIDRNNSPR